MRCRPRGNCLTAATGCAPRNRTDCGRSGGDLEGSSGPAEADDGDWVLRITLDTDDEQVTVTSIIDVLHAEAESPARPFTSEQSEVDEI